MQLNAMTKNAMLMSRRHFSTLLLGLVALPRNSMAADAAQLRALRGADLTKLVVHDQPKPVTDAPFFDETGKAFTLADFKGKVIVLNFWATWCAPCREEMPALDQLQQMRGSDRFVVITISGDRGGAKKARPFFDQMRLKHLTLYADAGAKLAYANAATALPTTLIIDRNGAEVGRLMGGAVWDGPDALAVVDAVLG